MRKSDITPKEIVPREGDFLHTGLRHRDLKFGDEDTIRKKRAIVIEETSSISSTLEDIKQALRLHRGSVTKAAEFLNVSRAALERKINNNPMLLQVKVDIRNEFLDNTEQKLMELVDEKNVTAVTFTLRTVGKERGYSEKNTLEHTVPGGIGSAASLIAEMRKGLDSVSDDNTVDVEDYEWKDEENL